MFGYACFNDGSYRDCQRKASQWTIGKNFDASGGFGPCLVTADELVMGMPGGVGYARTPPEWMKADSKWRPFAQCPMKFRPTARSTRPSADIRLSASRRGLAPTL